MFFVLISFAFGSQHKRSFHWNMGFRDDVPVSSSGTLFNSGA